MPLNDHGLKRVYVPPGSDQEAESSNEAFMPFSEPKQEELEDNEAERISKISIAEDGQEAFIVTSENELKRVNLISQEEDVIKSFDEDIKDMKLIDDRIIVRTEKDLYTLN